MLFPYNNEPETGSRIPSISTGGAAMKAMMNTEVAVNNVGIMITPNQPMYIRFSVDVIHSQKRAQPKTPKPHAFFLQIIFFYNYDIMGW